MTENNSSSSAHESDAILFWLEQEPVESNIDIYLPADTPIHRPSTRILYQISKKQELKKARTLERLKAYHYQGLADARRSFAKEAKKTKLPSTRYVQYLENMKSADFLSENAQEMKRLLKDINTLASNDEKSKSTVLEDIAKEREAYQQLQQANLKRQMEQEEKEQRSNIMELESFVEDISNYRTQYHRMVSLIQQKKENEQPRQQPQQQQQQQTQSQTIETAPLPPLPPRVSRNDPRERFSLAEHQPPATH